MSKLAYSKSSIVLIVLVSVVVIALAVLLNINYSGGEGAISGAYTYGAAVVLAGSLPSGHILDDPNRDDFERSHTDCFSRYKDGSLIEYGGSEYGGGIVLSREICIRTSGDRGSGTDSNILYWKDNKAGRCLYSDGTKKDADWKVEWVKFCRKVSMYGQTSSQCDGAVTLNKWLYWRSPDNIICW